MAVPTGIRFRTQDTRASWARKLNALLTPIAADAPAIAVKFRQVPQTQQQWQHELSTLRAQLIVAGYPLAAQQVGLFRLGDTRQMWARNLNRLAVALELGKQ